MKKKKEDIALGRRIKDIRAGLEMDQKTFSSRLGCTVSALSNWENGRNKPNDIMIKKIVKIGNISVDYLLNGHKDLLGNEMHTGDLAFYHPTLFDGCYLTKKEGTSTFIAYLVVKLTKNEDTEFCVLRCICRTDDNVLTEVYVENCPNQYDIGNFSEFTKELSTFLTFKEGNWLSHYKNFNNYIFHRKAVDKTSLYNLSKNIESQIKEVKFWEIKKSPQFFFIDINNTVKTFDYFFKK